MTTKSLTNLDLIKACDNFPYSNTPTLYTLHLPPDPRPHGYITPTTIALLPWTPSLEISHPNRTVSVLGPNYTAAFAILINTAIEQKIFPSLLRHSELFPILGAKTDVQIERFAADLFGITARGAHLTISTRDERGEEKVWVAKRSRNVSTYPGMMDSTVAGGVAAGETPLENIVREGAEEASLEEGLLRAGVKGAGVLTYISYVEEGEGKVGTVVPDVIYVYDLEVGREVVPRPGDEEVDGFVLMGVEEVRASLGRGEWKANSAMVMVDWLVRRGWVNAEGEEDLVEIVSRMHRRLPFAVTAGG